MSTVTAIGSPVDIGMIFPPREGEARGRGLWTGRDLAPEDVEKLLPRAAAANAEGAAIYVRLGPSAREHHPGIVLLDDVDVATVERLRSDGFQPRLVVETSPKNLQAWIGLSEHSVPYDVVLNALRVMVHAYGADPCAVSPMQPGRVGGYTNRKEKHRKPNGQFPFVRVVASDPGRIADAGPHLIENLRRQLPTQPPRAARAPETPRSVAPTLFSSRDFARLDGWRDEERRRFREEVERGSRPSTCASESEVDFAVARRALREGVSEDTLTSWIETRRDGKACNYAVRTVQAAAEFHERASKWRAWL